MSTPAGSARAGRLDLALAAGPLLLAALVYHPITRNFFHGDDFLNLYEIANEELLPFLLRMHGGHLLMSSNALFALLYRLFGADPAPYHWLAFSTHLANVALVFALVRRVTASSTVACFGATLWGTLPVNEGSLGWYSVYGHVMATSCVLAALLLVTGDAGRAPIRRLAALLLLVVAGTSFGVGLGVAMAMPAAVFFLLPAGADRGRSVAAFVALAVATPIAYFGVQHLSASTFGRSPAMAYQLAAQHYWTNSLRLLLELFRYGIACVALGIAHRPVPADGAALAGGLSAALAAAAFAWSKGLTRRRVLAFVLVAAGGYAVVAAGRALIGRGARAALMAGSTRFHYLAVAMLTVAVCLLVAEIGRRSAPAARIGRALLPAWMAALLVVHLWRGPVLPEYAYCRRETADVVGSVRAAVAAAAPGTNVYIENRGFHCVGPLLYAARQRFPGWAGVFAVTFATNVVDGRTVHFLEPDSKAVEKARSGRRTAGLVLSYEEVGRRAPAPEPPPPRAAGATTPAGGGNSE